MIDDRHFTYDTLSKREVEQRRLEEKAYDYLRKLCRTDETYRLRYTVFGKILTFNYNTLDDTGKLITIKRKVDLKEETVKDKRLLCTLHTRIFFDRDSNLFSLEET